LTGSCAVAIWLTSAFTMWSKVVLLRRARLSCKRRLSARRDALAAWIAAAHLKSEQFLFPSDYRNRLISPRGSTPES